MSVNLRLIMFHAFFHRATCCQGQTTQERANAYDRYFGEPEPEQEVISAAGSVGEYESVASSSTPEEVTVVSSAAVESTDSSAQPTLSFAHF
jgi:hypothetical protein